jgi:hypothetical protein
MHKNKIIFFSVLAIIINSVFLVFSLGVNLPISDEIDYFTFVKTFFDGGSWWEDSEFLQHTNHRLITYGLILLLSSIFDNGNIVNQMYLGLGFLVISMPLLYVLLKKTDTNLTWLMIPIAAILFNAGQSGCFLWGACGVMWYATTSLVILTIFFISKIEHQRIALLFAILSAVMVSFTSMMGLSIWIVGFLGLFFIKNARKISLISWTSSAIIVFLLYFLNYERRSFTDIQTHTLFTYEGFEYILLFLSNGLIVHLHQMYFIQIIMGIGIIITIIGCSIYLKLQKFESNKIIPWVQLGLFGILGAIATELGRIGIVGPVSSRYIGIAAFAQISSVVLVTILCIYFYKKLKNKRKKQIFKIFVSVIVIFLVFGISSSYYSGWKIGYDWLHENSVKQECLKDPVFDLKCRNIFDGEKQYENLKILRELQLSLFSEEIDRSIDPMLTDKNWENLKSVEEGVGAIKYINSHPHYVYDDATLPLKISVERDETPIDIGGWGIFTSNEMDVDSVYVFIDEYVNSKAYHGFLNSNDNIYGQKTKPSYFAGIGGIIDLQKLSDGCHTISLRIIHEEKYYNINTESQICIK